MKRVMWVVVGVMVLSLSAIALRAADEAKPADSSTGDKTEQKDTKKPAHARMFQPYSKLTSLSDEQKQKILEIRADFNAQRQELNRKEREQIMALLNDDQKKEVEKIEADRKTSGMKKTGSDSKTSDAKSNDTGNKAE
jgi:Spy/CpxP family protein refolding chaperone